MQVAQQEKIYIRAGHAHSIFDISKTAFWRLTKENTFPKKIKLMGSVVYKISELCNWADENKEVA